MIFVRFLVILKIYFLSMEVNISIKDSVLRSYLRSSSKINSDGQLVVSTSTIVGAVICSMVCVCNFKPPERNLDSVVSLYIPVSYYTCDLRDHFLMIKPEGEKHINNVLRHEFNMVLLNYCNVKTSQGIKLKTALYDFMSDYGLIDKMDFQSIRKRHYRASIDAMTTLYDSIRNRYYYLSEKHSSKK